MKLINHIVKTMIGNLGVVGAKGQLRLIRDLLPDKKARKGEFKLNLRGHCQADSHSCGVMAGWCVLESFNPRAQFKQFDKDCAADKEWGISSKKLAQALRNQGLRVSYAKINFKSIQTELQSGRPILTFIHRKDDEWHWVAIYGFGLKPSRIFYIGKVIPGFSRGSMRWHQFKAKLDLEDSSLVVSILPQGKRARAGRASNSSARQS